MVARPTIFDITGPTLDLLRRDAVYIAGSLSAGVTAVFGAAGNGPVWVACQLIALDVVTGLLKAGTWGVLNSDRAAKGMRKKIGLVLVMVLGRIADQRLGSGDMVKGVMANYVSAVELLSILENLAALGIVLPTPVASWLQGMSFRKPGDPPTKGREE